MYVPGTVTSNYKAHASGGSRRISHMTVGGLAPRRQYAVGTRDMYKPDHHHDGNGHVESMAYSGGWYTNTNSRRQGKKRDRFGKPKKRRKKYRKHYVSKVVHDTIVTQLGDSDILSTDRNTQNAKIEPVLRVYPRCPLMCNTNDDLDEGRGNGTACEVVSVKLKKNGKERKWKNWEGRKVWTVSVDDVEWIDCEHTPKPPKGKASRFRLTPKDFSATIDFPLHENLPPIKVGNAVVRQFPVNSNLATTGHKLQGMSKDVLIVNSWDYRCANWVYVVLSRVRTRKGLFLVRPLDLDKDFNVPQKLLDFEERMKRLKEQPIMDRFRRAGGY
eukprot:scaffold13992_cov123-Skeletonema_menzelii.AAC.1